MSKRSEVIQSTLSWMRTVMMTQVYVQFDIHVFGLFLPQTKGFGASLACRKSCSLFLLSFISFISFSYRPTGMVKNYHALFFQ